MAFTINAAATVPSTSSESWKAQGFLNLYLPSKNGQRRKLGAIPLRVSKTNEAQLLQWLSEDPSRVKVILEKLEIDFQTSEPKPDSGFDL